MPTIDPLSFDTEIPPNDNIEEVGNKLGRFQNKFNNLDSDLQNAIISTNPKTSPGSTKTPAKIFDPIFGPDVIFGFVMTSDFMSFCDYKPLSRVGDLVFVVGIVGITVVAEIGVITSGCMDVRNNSIGSGTPYPGGPGTGGLKGGCSGQKVSKLYVAEINADVLNPLIIDRIAPCLNSGDLANCLPSIVQDIMGLCNETVPNLGYGVANDFHLDTTIQKFGADYLSRLNTMLKNGFCGNPKIDVQFTRNRTLERLNKSSSDTTNQSTQSSNQTSPDNPCNVIKVESNDDAGKENPSGTNDAAMSIPAGSVNSPEVSNPYANIPNGIPGDGIYNISYNSDGYGSSLNASCVSEHMNYLSNELDKTLGISFNDTLGDAISNHDLEIVTLTNDIKNYYDSQFMTDVRNMLNKFPSEFPENSAEAMNLALEIANDLFNGKSNLNRTVESYKNIVNEMKLFQEKLKRIAEKPLDEDRKSVV